MGSSSSKPAIFISGPSTGVQEENINSRKRVTTRRSFGWEMGRDCFDIQRVEKFVRRAYTVCHRGVGFEQFVVSSLACRAMQAYFSGTDPSRSMAFIERSTRILSIYWNQKIYQDGPDNITQFRSRRHTTCTNDGNSYLEVESIASQHDCESLYDEVTMLMDAFVKDDCVVGVTSGTRAEYCAVRCTADMESSFEALKMARYEAMDYMCDNFFIQFCHDSRFSQW